MIAKVKRYEKERAKVLEGLGTHLFYAGIMGEEYEFQNESVEEEVEKYGQNGYYPAAIGEVIMSRYVLLQKIAKGSFSTVWFAKDVKNNNYEVVKVKRNLPNYKENSFYEIEVLQKTLVKAKSTDWKNEYRKLVGRANAKPHTHIVKMLNSFIYESKFDLHFCLVFELLDVSLRTVINRYDRKGVPLKLSREIVRQILVGLHFLHTHCQIVYNNLQPENVMFAFPKSERQRIEKTGQLRTDNDKASGVLLKARELAIGIRKNTILLNKGRLSKSIQRQVNEFHNVQAFNFQQSLKQNPNDSLESFGICGLSNSMNEMEDDMTDRVRDNGEDLRDGSVPMTEEQFKVEFDKLAQEKNLTTKKELKNLKRKMKKKMKKYLLRMNNFPRNDVSLRLIQRNVRNRIYLPKTVKSRRLDSADSGLANKFKVKLIDFAPAFWVNRQLMSDFTVEKYRAPECLLGMTLNTATDIWALGCMVFEVLVGESLFTPTANKNLSKKEEHLAQMIELLDNFPVKVATASCQHKRLFNSKGKLKKDCSLNFMSIRDSLVRIHKVREEEAQVAADFLKLMLRPDPLKRASASDLLKHPFLSRDTDTFFATAEDVSKDPDAYSYPEGFQSKFNDVNNEEEFDADASFSSSEIDDVDDEDDRLEGSENELRFFEKGYRNNHLFYDHIDNYKIDNTSSFH